MCDMSGISVGNAGNVGNVARASLDPYVDVFM